MTKLVLTVLVSCLSMAMLTAQKLNSASAKDVSVLNEFRERYVQAWINKNPEAIQVYYSDHIRVMPELQKTLIGKTNVALYSKAFLNRFDVNDYTRNEMEIVNLGCQTLEIGKLMMEITLKSSGKKFHLEGTYLNLWERTSDGKLLLITEAWNYDHYYSEIHEYLRFNEVQGIHVAFLPIVDVDTNISFELTALNRLLDATVTQHDAKVWVQYYADDAMLIPNYHVPCKGKSEIKDYLEMHVKELPIFEELDIRNDRIDNAGDYIIEYASHIASWKNRGTSGVGLGKNIRIWRREPDHSLKIFRSISMYD